jgi:hypothetical protein
MDVHGCSNWTEIMLAEFRRLIRRKRWGLQIKNDDSGIPDNFPESEIFISSDDAARGADFSSETQETMRTIRREAIALLRQIPAVVSAARSLAGAGNLYRVRVSKENVHLLREGLDGVVKPFIRGMDGKFVENVDLIRVPPQIAAEISNIMTQAALAEVNAKLDILANKVDNLAELVRLANRGALEGAIHGLEVAQQLNHKDQRQQQILDACQHLFVQLGQVIGQMAAHVNQMPSADIGFWSGWKDQVADAEKAYAVAGGDFAIVLDGLQRIVASYLEVGQNAAAARAFSLICGKLDAILRRAADRSRLLPYPADGDGPESAFQDFLLGRPTVEARLDALAAGVRPSLSFMVNPSDLAM